MNAIAVALDQNDEPVTLVLTAAELLILRWYRGDTSVTPAMLEAALAKAAAKPGP